MFVNGGSYEGRPTGCCGQTCATIEYEFCSRLCCITPCCEPFNPTENNEMTRMYRENRDLINQVNQFISENERDGQITTIAQPQSHLSPGDPGYRPRIMEAEGQLNPSFTSSTHPTSRSPMSSSSIAPRENAYPGQLNPFGSEEGPNPFVNETDGNPFGIEGDGDGMEQQDPPPKYSPRVPQRNPRGIPPPDYDIATSLKPQN